MGIGGDAVDPISGTQPLKSCLCEVRRAEGGAG
jgi:hypothetical protein